jgi:hypothetical protein
MDTSLIDNLMAVQEHLDRKRQKLKRDYEEIEATLSGIRREIAAQRTGQAALFPEVERAPARTKFQNISMRWAILWLLSESLGPMQTPSIADALRDGGVAERPNFNSIVSAILSQMAQKREVERIDSSGYQLTDDGRQIWEGVQRSEKFLNRHLISASDAE